MYSKLFIFSLLLLLSFFLSSCIKPEIPLNEVCNQNCTIIKGILMSKNGTLPITNVPIKLVRFTPALFSGGSVNDRAITNTKPDGSFEFSIGLKDFELNEGHRFSIEFKLDTLYKVEHHIAYMTRLKRDTTFNLGICNIPRKSYLQVNNSVILNNQDNISFFNDSKIGFNSDMQSSASYNYWSVINNSSQKITIAADQKVYLNISKNINGIINTKKDSVIVAEGQIQNYQINF